MLTWPDLIALCEARRLVAWSQRPQARIEAGDRVLYMLPEVYDKFQTAPWPDSDGENPKLTAERRTAMRAVLNRYVTGKTLVIRNDLKELGTEPRREKMRGLWEFRSQGRMSETRLLGYFARPAAFIALEFESRDVYDGDGEWVNAKDRCRHAWSLLTGKALPMIDPWPVVIRNEMMEYTNVSD